MDHQNIVITGGGTGIGQALALALAKTGSRLELIGRRSAELQETAEAIAKTGATAAFQAMDLTDSEAREQFVQELSHKYRRLDVLAHCAADLDAEPLSEASDASFDTHFDINVRVPFSLTRRLLPLLREGSGQVVFMSSSAVRGPAPGFGLYAASKHALRGLADALRQEENAAGVRVLSVYPGRTATPMQERLAVVEGRAYRPERLLQASDVAEAVVSALDLPPTAEVTDLYIRPNLPPAPSR